MPKSANVNEPSPHDSDRSLHRGRSRRRRLIVRWTAGIVLTLISGGARCVVLAQSSEPKHRAAEASSTAILPIEHDLRIVEA